MGKKANTLEINIVCSHCRVYIEKEVNQSSLCTSKLFQINLLRHNLQKIKRARYKQLLLQVISVVLVNGNHQNLLILIADVPPKIIQCIASPKGTYSNCYMFSETS